METRFQIGVISSTHGIRGEVKVFPTTDDPKRFKKLKEVILDTGKEELVLKIQGVKFFKKFVILKFEGYDVYVVGTPDGKELLFPAIRECIRKVDIQKQLIQVHVMPGLLD